MIVYSQHALETVIPDVFFMGGNIEVVSSEKHLGNYIGNITQKDLVSRITNDFLCRVNMITNDFLCRVNMITNDFLCRVNMVKSHFKHLPVHTIYSLFKSYCMPLYGSLLWDLGSPAMNIFHVAWRKSTRHLLNLPRTTHCSLLNYICNDVSIVTQLCNRYVDFIKSLSLSNNACVSNSVKLIQKGSQSAVSNSM